jgi:hypothetical protein
MKKKEIDIFKVAKKAAPPTEEKALDNAFEALQIYLHIIKDDKEKISDFNDLVDTLFRDANKAFKK